MTTPRDNDTLRDIARQVERLSLDRRDPERFHIEKSDIVHRLITIANRQNKPARRSPQNERTGR